MPHPLRVFWPGMVYEITTSTVQGRFLLAPTASARELILGVLGRAQSLYPGVHLHAFVFLSNHAHMLVSADDGRSISAFVGYVNGNIARELGRLHDWPGPFWHRRFRPIPILDDEALVARLRYILAHGAKEGLVATPRDWPGASALPALLGEEIEGVWYQRNLEYQARRRGQPIAPSAASIRYRITLSPLPCWAELPVDEQRCRVARILEEIEAETRAARRETGLPPLAPETLLRVHPHTRPHRMERSPAPLCHTSHGPLRRRFRALYQSIRDAFIDAARALARGTRDVAFPAGTFPPSLPFVPAEPLSSPWRLHLLDHLVPPIG
jgi:REP element-mobilizing transposase RayT